MENTRKVIMAGDGACGKSCLVGRFMTDRFTENYMVTIGSQFATKKTLIDNGTREVTLVIWDLAGQQQFDFIRKSFYNGASAILLVYDVTRISTLRNVEKWVKEIKSSLKDEVPIILVGNKTDCGDGLRKVTYDMGEDEKDRLGLAAHIETSALSGDNVEHTFTLVAEYAFNSKS